MPCRLLIVDDEQTICFALTEFFRLRAYKVDSATTEAEAEELLSRTCYEIVITDLSLSGRGGTEGLDLLALIRREYSLTRTVILTAYGSAEVEAVARQLGVDAFLHKPPPLAQIARIVHNLLHHQGESSTDRQLS